MLQKNMWTELRDKLLHNSEQFTSTESSDITSARGPPLKYFNPSKIFLAPSVWAEFIIQLNLTPHRARVQIKSFHSEAFSVRSLALISPSNHVKIATACSTLQASTLLSFLSSIPCVCVTKPARKSYFHLPKIYKISCPSSSFTRWSGCDAAGWREV